MNASSAALLRRWKDICALTDIVRDTGVAALVEARQVAIFRVGDAVYAIGNYDPASCANVLARGIVGDLDGEPVVASPIYKQHYSLITGRCLEEPGLSVPVFPARIQDGRIWILGEAVAPRCSAGKRRLVVIGNGMAAMRTLEELLKLAPHAFDITVFGAEPLGSYNRILLSALLAGDKQRPELITHPPSWYSQHGIRLHCGDPVIHIDRARRTVRSRSGVELPYDRLLMATGSRALVLPVPGAQLPGAITFRDLNDVELMIAAAREPGQAVVIGGGLLGLEAAHGLQRRGMAVTVVHACDHLMERQLDAPAAELLQRELESRGLNFVMPARTIRISGDTRATGVVLQDGRELRADLIVMAVGVQPEIELARAAGLQCARGILVDDCLLTYDPGIYAVGECVQHRGQTFGLVAPLWEQARVCAAHLAERSSRGYRCPQLGTRLKVGGIDVFSAGDYAAGPATESLVLRDPRLGIYKRLLVENDRVRGAVLYGDVRDAQWYLDLINQSRDIRDVRDQLLLGSASATTTHRSSGEHLTAALA